MTISSQLEFDYLVEAQTQKHLTVNNALARLDACSQLVISGDVNAVANKSEGNIFTQSGTNKLAIYLNGGLEYVTPKEGWKAYFLSDKTEKRFDGTSWVLESQGQGDVHKPNRIEKLVDLSQDDPLILPDKSVVFGITARVKETITGGDGLTSWRMGVWDDHTRYGRNLWLGKNGRQKGLTGVPITYWSDTPVLIQGEGADIQSGQIMLYLYLQQLEVPDEF